MKKIITPLLFLAMALVSFAQTNQSLYRFTTREQAGLVLKAIITQVTLTETEFAQVRDLLYASASGQEEISKHPDGNSPQIIENTTRRQTMHIEDNLKTIIGEEKFKEYQAKKSAIERKAIELSSSKN